MWYFISDTVPQDREVLLAGLDHDGFHALEFSIDVRPTHWREWFANID